jgi:Uma2 family endonuclease
VAKARPATDLPWTVEEFDRWHARQPDRWELIGGVPVMMSSPAQPHTTIKGNIFAALRAKLAGKPCRVYVDGVEVKEKSRRLSAIPDVVVECHQPYSRSPEIKEPTVLVEILSPSSERDDTGRKWQGYCLIPSLRHYLIVDQEERFVTVHTRTGPSSFAEEVVREGAAELSSLGVTLTLDEIYEDVEFTAPGGTDSEASGTP